MLGATQSRAGKVAPNRDEGAKMDSGQKGRIRNEKFRRDAMVKPITTYICHPETPFVVWPCNEKRRNTCCKESNNDEGKRPRGRPILRWMDRVRSDLRQHQLEPKLAQNREEEGNHGDRHRTGIRSAKVSKCEQIIILVKTSVSRFNKIAIQGTPQMAVD